MCLFDPEVLGIAPVISDLFVDDVHSHLLGGPCLLTSETEAETSSSSSKHVRPPRHRSLRATYWNLATLSEFIELTIQSEAGRICSICFLINQSPFLPPSLVWDQRMKLDCLPSDPVLWQFPHNGQQKNASWFCCRDSLLLDKCRWMDSMDRELLLHRREVALHLLPIGNRFSTKCPKRSSYLFLLSVLV